MAACELQQRVDLLYDLTNARLGEARNNTGAATVYGEISSPEELFTALDMNASDHFVDLGSGRGQIVLAAMMRTRGAPASAAGMELIVNRCQVAERAWHNASASVQEKVKFFCGDALQFDLSTATKIFLCNATFPGELSENFAQRFTLKNAFNLQRLATIQPLSDSAVAAAGVELARVTSVRATWCSGGCPLYVYARPGTVEKTEGDGVVDKVAIARMLEERRENDQKAMAHAATNGSSITTGEAERGSLRTALIAAAMGDL